MLNVLRRRNYIKGQQDKRIETASGDFRKTRSSFKKKTSIYSYGNIFYITSTKLVENTWFKKGSVVAISEQKDSLIIVS
jgi:hypothetical protein